MESFLVAHTRNMWAKAAAAANKTNNKITCKKKTLKINTVI